MKFFCLKKTSFFNDPSLWMLLAINGWLIYSYTQNPDMINDIIILYYIQSVLIGVVNIASLYSFNNYTGQIMVPGNIKEKKNGCLPLFFGLHYGAFHLIYLFFLAGIVDIHKMDYNFIKTTCYVLIGNAIINFVHDKMRNREEPVNIGVMFFMPYARVVPMHLMILLPEFFAINRSITFLLLKTGADVVMFMVQRRAMFAPSKNSIPGLHEDETFI